MTNFFQDKVLFVSQPFSDFYVASMPVSKLVEVCYSFTAVFGEDLLTGVQRGINDKRVKDISEFSLKENAMFPNAVILSVNISEDGEIFDDEIRWRVTDNDELIIPTNAKCASIVDGQHRVEGLKKALASGKLDPEFRVVCAIYFELAAPQQAEVFATINFNQQKVDKSLAYQLFGYDLDSTKRESWAPDTFAIYVARLLNKEENSPFFDRISYGMKKSLYGENEVDWHISTSTVVEGVCRLISKNPTKDRYSLHAKKIIKNTRSDLELGSNPPPLREYYRSMKDSEIYDLIFSFFQRVKDLTWEEGISFMHKTIGVQATFDILRLLTKEYGPNKYVILEKLSLIDRNKLSLLNVNFSGIGRTQIREELKSQLGLN